MVLQSNLYFVIQLHSSCNWQLSNLKLHLQVDSDTLSALHSS